MSNGIDVSHYQGIVDYGKVAAAGYEFVIVKATQGSKHESNIIDPFFVRNIEEAHKHGLQTNAYHYFLGVSENDARAEADLFIENLNKVKDKLTGYVFIDVEDHSLSSDKEALTRYVNAFLDQLSNHGYTKLGIYSGRSFFLSRFVPSRLKGGILKWIAAYNDKGAGIPCDIWQHSSSGVVPGVNGRCDVNISYTAKIGKPKPTPKEEVKVSEGPFKDVPKGHWAEGAIEKVKEADIMRGYKDDTFKPDQNITRAEVAATIAKLLKFLGK
jgi:lysozyme